MSKLTPFQILVAQLLAVLLLVVGLLLAPVLAGAVAALLLLAGWAPALRDLLIALRPLLMPIVLIALVGAIGEGLSDPFKLLVGVIAVLLVVPRSAGRWLAGDSVEEDTRRVVRTTFKASVAALGVLAAIVLLMVAVPGSRGLLGDFSSRYDELGGLPGTIALCSVLVWLGAIALRMGGFVRTWGRSIVALALAIAAAWALLDLDVSPLSTPSWPSVMPVAIVAGALLVALLALEALHDPARAAALGRVGWLATLQRRTAWAVGDGLGPARARRWEERARRHWARGLGAAIASTLALALALGYGWEDVHRSSADVASASGERGTAAPEGDWRALAPERLARRFMPVLAFSSEQRWLPQRVEAYVGAASLRPRPGPDVPLAGGLPRGCRDGELDPCFRLHCPSADAPCALAHDYSQRRGRHRDADSAVYARIVKRGEPPVDRSPPVFDKRIGPYGEELSILLQYWLFYPYDEWRAPVLGARLEQRHAGDWENVTIGLSDTRPLFVAYSQHCGGRWVRWRDVRVSDWPSGGSHPLVAVAVGSHANYERPDDVRSPNWTSCSNVPARNVELLGYVWNIRDRTRSDWELLPQQVELVNASVPPMTFPGTWGTSDQMQLVAFNTMRFPGGAGPRTPTRQPLWQRPVQQIFCDADWRGPQGAPCRRGAG